MVSVQKIGHVTRQQFGNLPSQTGNFGAAMCCMTKLLNFVACVTWALDISGYASMCVVWSTYVQPYAHACMRSICCIGFIRLC